MNNLLNMSRSEIETLIDEYIVGQHAQRNRGILKRRLLDGVIFEKLAEEYDMSDRQIKNIVYKSEKMLFKRIK